MRPYLLCKLTVRAPDKTSFFIYNAFSFDTKGPKEKALQKEKPVVISLSAESDQGAAFGNRKLFKKSLSKNFARVVQFLPKLFLH